MDAQTNRLNTEIQPISNTNDNVLLPNQLNMNYVELNYASQ